jgi:DmsE family decaheme c-type cytochrome
MGYMLKKTLLPSVWMPLILLAVFLTGSVLRGSSPDRNEMLERTSDCLACHDDMEESLRGSPHRLAGEGDLSSPVIVGCIGCHDGWQEHIDDPTPENISSGPELGLVRQAEVCGRCHSTPHQIAMLASDPHGRRGLTCSDCHTMHSNLSRKLTKDERENYCLACHFEVAAQFKSRSTHPLESGNLRCMDCHEIGNIRDHDLVLGLDWKCRECHSEYAGPFIYEHPVTYDHLVEGSGCVECHQPHGSANERLLRQPQSGTCLQCHMIPPGHRIAHSGLGSRYACAECHSDIHGSDNNSCFLDPDLGMKLAVNCYTSGCHAAAQWGGE